MLKPEIETISRRTVYQNRWMSVHEDAIIRADGSLGIYGVVDKPDFAVIAAVRDQHLYLVEQFRYPLGRRMWELPQGSWEGRAVDPLTLAQAELREETGLVAGRMQHVAQLFLAGGYSAQAYDLYFASDLIQGARQLDAEEQGLICQSFAIEVVEQMILDGTIKDATTVAAFGMLRLKGLI